MIFKLDSNAYILIWSKYINSVEHTQCLIMSFNNGYLHVTYASDAIFLGFEDDDEEQRSIVMRLHDQFEIPILFMYFVFIGLLSMLLFGLYTLGVTLNGYI